MGTLYIVSTPIGNIEDISLRALNILKTVTAIFAEDTRRTGKLLSHYEIKTSTYSYHEHNVERAIPQVLSYLEKGDVALVSDGGTPLISDPGFKLVRELKRQNFKVEAVPGASAVLSALVVSGLPTDKFSFRGFLPRKSGKLEKEFREISDREETVIYYESPHRVNKSLPVMLSVFGEDRMVSVCRELTKIHEEVITGRLVEVVEAFKKKENIKGEFVVLVAKANN